MIFKRKNKNFFKKYFNFFKNISAVVVIIQVLIVLFLFSYYQTSALSQKIPFDRVKNKIFKVIGFDYNQIKLLPKIYVSIFSSFFNNSDIKTINISLNQKSLINLDLQRQSRLNKSDYSPCNMSMGS